MTKNIISNGADISSYNTSSNKYTIPGDGYLVLAGGTHAATGTVIRLFGPSDNKHYIRIFIITTIDSLGSTESVFVRKGMRVYVETDIMSSEYSLSYYQLV